MHVVRGCRVVQKIEDSDAREGFGDDVGEQGGRGAGIETVFGPGEDGEDVGELGAGVDDDEDVGDVESVGVPEEHPR